MNLCGEIRQARRHSERQTPDFRCRLRRAGVALTLAALAQAFAATAQSAPPPPVPPPSTAAPSLLSPVAERVLREWPAGRIATVKHPGEWSYEEGVLLDGMAAEWRATGDGRLFRYIQAAVDATLAPDGSVRVGETPLPVWQAEHHTLDDVEMGRSAVLLYRVTQNARYYHAAEQVHAALEAQPRNAAGGYWHKQIYPDQMWLDGAYMAGPFAAQYTRTFEGRAATSHAMDEVINQLLLLHAHTLDRRTGLLRHGWDGSGKAAWAEARTGQSPEVWARAVGWYAMAVMDVLERVPATDPQRAALEDVARQTMAAVIRAQDRDSGLWWQVMDKPQGKGNYLEASASAMFCYALAKGVRTGVLPLADGAAADKAWAAIESRFVKPDGTVTGTVQAAGLGGTPYRSGTYEYYLSEPVVDNDAKGVGAVLLAHSEMLQRRRARTLLPRAEGETVLVDGWFNSQTRRTASGREELYHYKFTDDADSGYSLLGRMFAQYGMRTDVLEHAPRAADLRDVAVYIIASPDIPAKNPHPHYMDAESAAAIATWVRNGGVLLMMENDSEHADQEHFDLLADMFGMHFNTVTHNREINGSYASTIVPIAAGAGGIFSQDHRALMKETCTLTLRAPATAVVTHMDAAAPAGSSPDTMMAVAHPGRGLVFANVDPWIYNEYTDGRKLPLEEDNFAAGQELVRWVVEQLPARK